MGETPIAREFGLRDLKFGENFCQEFAGMDRDMAALAHFACSLNERRFAKAPLSRGRRLFRAGRRDLAGFLTLAAPAGICAASGGSIPFCNAALRWS
jgi:hypothetical protein